MSSATARLKIGPGARVFLIQCPRVVTARLEEELPSGAKLTTRGRGPFPVVLAFVARQREVERVFTQARNLLAPGGVFFIAYPKRSSGVKTDLTRRIGWEPLKERGWAAVSQVSIDETWVALRFQHDPALKTLRTARRLKRGSEAKTVKMKQGGAKKTTVKLRKDDIAPTSGRGRSRRRSAPTISLRASKRGKAVPPPVLDDASKRRASSATAPGKKAVVRAPKDVREALSDRPAAKRRWSRLPPPVKQELLDYIDEVKRSDARARRIERTVDDLEDK